MGTVPNHVLSTNLWGVSFTAVFRDLKALGDDTLAERYERTMARMELITNAGYTVKVMCECEFQESRIIEMKPHLLTHPIVTHSPLHTRDALYGGRT